MKNELTITRMSTSSWFKIIYQEKIIHVDPGFGGFYENQGIPEAEMIDKADYILVSHEHKDHIRVEAIEKLYAKHTKMICSKSCSKELTYKHDVILPNEYQVFNDFSVEAMYAYNTEEGHSTRKYHPKDNYLGFVMTFGQFRVYFAGDTDITEEMRSLENIDVAMLPIGGTYVMDLDEAVLATKIIRPTYVIPMHHAHEKLEVFREKVEKETQSKAILLNNGDTFTFR